MAQEWEKLTPLPASVKALLQRVADASSPVATAASSEPAAVEPTPCSTVKSVLCALESQHSAVKKTHESVADCLQLLKEVDQYRSAIITQSTEFSSSCADLVTRRDHLIRLSSELQSKYVYYTQLEGLMNEVELLQQNTVLARRKLMPILRQLEDCIQFFRDNPQYQRSGQMLKAYSDLKEEWLMFFEKHVVATFSQFYAQEQDKIYKKIPDFDAVQTTLKALKEKGDIEDLCFDTFSRIEQNYLQIRLKMLLPSVQAQVEKILSGEKDSVKLLRNSCELLQRNLHKEQKLYSYYFASEDTLRGIKDPLGAVSTRLYEALRPKIIKEQSVDVLCELAEMLKTEFLRENFMFFTRVFQDIQERLMYRVQVYTSSEIYGYDGPITTPHPVLDRTIKLLAQLYNRVDYAIFKGLGQEAVVACLSFLKEHMIAQDFISAHIDLISHILQLRREIEAMYEHVELSVRSTELDFSSTKHLFWKIITGEVSLRAGPGLAEIVQLGAPKLTETTLDTKQLIHEELRIACQSLILQIFHAASDAIIKCLMKVRYVQLLTKEEVDNAISQSKKSIGEIMPVACKRVRELSISGKEQLEIIKAARLQILKAFQQLLAHGKKTYQDHPLPTILDIEKFVTESSEFF